ncbi:MAG: 4-oxalocrotonate tautomerase family protein [Gemmatimonadota bacterium]|jgi:4-oxalocrotonate tautomerase family enzyme
MPIANIHIVGTATRAQKAELVKEVTDAIVRILGKDRNRTSVIIHEMPSDNWGVGGLLRDDWLKQQRDGGGPGSG